MMKRIRDRRLKTLGSLTEQIKAENERQIATWGIQVRTPFEWLAYLTEELGELSEAISEEHYRDGNKENVHKEAIQVATLALKIAEAYW